LATELKQIADQLKQLNKTMDKLTRLIDEITKVEDMPLEEKLQALIKLNPESKYILVFGEEMTEKDADRLNELLLQHLGESRVFFVGGVELQTILELPNEIRHAG
jgi:hypothetical protein